VAEHRFVAAGEQRGHVATVECRHDVTHEKHAAMCLMKPLVLQPPIDLIAAYTDSEQLRPRYNPVLATRQLSNRPVSISTAGFAGHVPVNPTLDFGAPGSRAVWRTLSTSR
jgi:hypothetical protein